ncbi:RhaT Permeases of the drug/metabolite transporter (DMT) superfamily [Burkholderiaceae bacterium]
MPSLWMLLAAVLFATMGVCVKFASEYFHALDIVFYRGLVGVVVLGLVMKQQRVAFRSPVPMMHFWRSLVGVVSLVGWFYSIGQLPLATAVTLNYTSSVWIATFLLGGAVLFNQRSLSSTQTPLMFTIVLGFVGVALVLRPTLSAGQLVGGMVGLLSGMFAALAYLQVASLARTGEPDSRTVWYFSLCSVLAGGLGMLVLGGTAWSGWHTLWLLPIGLLALGGQLCMTRAYASGATLVVANLQYTGIVFASLYGVWIFGDRIDAFAVLGIGLIIVSGVVATALRARAIPKAPAEEH